MILNPANLLARLLKGASLFLATAVIAFANATLVQFTTAGNVSYVVPDGVTELTAYVWGGGGGGAGGSVRAGGGGALAWGTLEVTPGETLTIAVGGGGSSAGANQFNNTSGRFSGVFRGAPAQATSLIVAGGGAGGISGTSGQGGQGTGGTGTSMSPSIATAGWGYIAGTTATSGGRSYLSGTNTGVTVGQNGGTNTPTPGRGMTIEGTYYSAGGGGQGKSGGTTSTAGSPGMVILVFNSLSSQVVDFEEVPDLPYDTPPFNLVASASSGLPVTLRVVSGPATLSGETISFTGIGTVTVEAAQSGDATYAAAVTTQSFEVTPLAQAPVYIYTSPTTGAAGDYDARAAGGSGTGAYRYVLGSGSTAPNAAVDWGTGLVTYSGTGTIVLRAYRQASGVYAQSDYSPDFVLTVAKSGQSGVTIDSPATMVYGNPYYATAHGGSSSGAMVYRLASTGTTAAGAEINSSTGLLTTKSSGAVAIEAYRAGDSIYNDSPTSARFTITVQKRPLSATFSGSKPYDGTTTPLGASGNVTAGTFAPGDSHTISFSNTSSPNAGTYTGLLVVNVTNAEEPTDRSSSYAVTTSGSFSINMAPQNAPVVTPGQNGYDSGYQVQVAPGGYSALEFELVAGSTAPGASVSPSGLVTTTGQGTVAVRARHVADANYLASDWSSAEPVNITIAPRPVTLTGVVFQNKPYDGTVTAYVTGALALSGVHEGDNVTLAGTPMYSFASADVGTGITVSVTGVSLGGPDAWKYVLSPLTGTANIEKADQVITFDEIGDHTFGDGPVTLNATASSGLPVTLAVVSGPGSLAGTTLSFTGAGTILVRASQAGDDNHNPAADVERVSIIAKRNLVVIAGSASRPFNGSPLAVPEPSVDGLAPGDSVTGSVRTTQVGPADGTYPTSVTSITTALGISNYQVTYVTGTATITQLDNSPLSITSPDTHELGMDYVASASGGGSGSLAWELGPGTTAAANLNTSSGITQVSSEGVIEIRVYRTLTPETVVSKLVTVTKRAQSVASSNASVPVGTPFVPVVTGGSGSGAWQMRVGSGDWEPLGNVDTSAIGAYSFFVRKLGDGIYQDSPAAGAYTLFVTALNTPQTITVRPNNSAVWARAAGTQIYRKANAAGTAVVDVSIMQYRGESTRVVNGNGTTTETFTTDPNSVAGPSDYANLLYGLVQEPIEK